MEKERFDSLTNGERACLRLVLTHSNSKSIARELNLSAHTVDTYLRIAARKLGVEGRHQAALLLREHEEIATSSLRYQSEPLAEARRSTLRDVRTPDGRTPEASPQSPGPGQGRHVNDAWHRKLLIVLVVMLASALTIALFAIGYLGLSQIIGEL